MRPVRDYRSPDPLRATGALLHEHSDVPPDMTLSDWRRAGRAAAAPRRKRRLGLGRGARGRREA